MRLVKIPLLLLFCLALFSCTGQVVPRIETPREEITDAASENQQTGTQDFNSPQTGILFISTRNESWDIYHIQPDGTGLVRLTSSPEVDADPAWSPDGTRIAFRSRQDGSSDIFIMGADGSNPVNLISDPQDSFYDEFAPSWNPREDILAIYTDRFPERGKCSIHQLALMPVAGGADTIQLADQIPGGVESFAWSPDGQSIAYVNTCSKPVVNIFLWHLQTNQKIQLTKGNWVDFSPSFSADGEFLAFASNRDGDFEIYILELSSGIIRPLTDDPADDMYPCWSPDGLFIAFTSNRDGNDEIYVMNSDGSHPRNITRHPAWDWRPAWSPIP